MLDYPAPIRTLVSVLRQLPTIGPRSAERLALYLIQQDTALNLSLADALQGVRTKIKACSICGFYSDQDTCEICRDPKRDRSVICVVERTSDVLTMERSACFNGLYHVLGGTLSPLDGVGPEQLNFDSLIKRVQTAAPTNFPIKEIVFALGHDVKGETTALYLSNQLKTSPIRLSRLATGLSVGGSLEYADPQTLGHALQGRKEI